MQSWDRQRFLRYKTKRVNYKRKNGKFDFTKNFKFLLFRRYLYEHRQACPRLGENTCNKDLYTRYIRNFVITHWLIKINQKIWAMKEHDTNGQ